MIPARGAAAAYPLLLALGALDATGYSVIVPVAPAIADATGAGPATIGLLVASFPAGMVAGFALAGRAIRRYGARPLLVELTKAEKWNGLPYTMIPGSTVPFIEVAPPATQQ